MDSSPLVALLGPTLSGKDGDVATSTLSKNEVVGLYFSAHWCPPCRGFTPKLGEIYQGLKDQGKAIELVFVSSDRDQASFDEYFGEMPFLALPFNERELKNKLSKKFKVSGIPTLVLLDGATGKVLTTDGRSVITEDAQGKNFPWTPKSVAELLGDEFVKAGGEPVGPGALKGKSVALYFSAHWCPPCRGFTPKLAETYKAMKASGKDDFEFVFVSSDRDQASFDEYLGEMPWIALPFAKRAEKDALSRRFGVSGIPTLVTLGPDGEVVSTSARGAVEGDPTGAAFPWPPKAVEELSQTVECHGSDVNESPAVVLVADKSPPATQESFGRALLSVAEAHYAKARGGGDDEEGCIFFTAFADAGPVPQVKRLCGLDGGGSDGANNAEAVPQPLLLLLDIPDEGGFYTRPLGDVEDEAGVAAATTAFIVDWKAKTMKRQQLKR